MRHLQYPVSAGGSHLGLSGEPPLCTQGIQASFMSKVASAFGRANSMHHKPSSVGLRGSYFSLPRLVLLFFLISWVMLANAPNLRAGYLRVPCKLRRTDFVLSYSKFLQLSVTFVSVWLFCFRQRRLNSIQVRK